MTGQPRDTESLASLDEEPSVLVVSTRSPVVDRFVEWLATEWRVAVEGHPDEDRLRDSDVVVLDHADVAIDARAVADRLAARGPTTQHVAVADGDERPDADLTVTASATHEALRDVIASASRRAAYARGVERYFAAVRTRELVRAGDGGGPSVRRLNDRVQRLEAAVADVATDLDDGDYRALFRSLGPDDLGQAPSS
mgnify:CR=1 FL=1